MTKIEKENFAKWEGWSNWESALQAILSSNNEYILDDFIDKYMQFTRKNRRNTLGKAITILEEALELISKHESRDEDLLKNYRELIGETSRLKEYIQKHNY